MRFSRSHATTLVALAGAMAFAACGDSTDPGDDGGGGGGGGGGSGAAAISVVSGDAQQAKTLETLGQPLVVRVDDASGSPVSGATVNWTVSSGSGTVSSASTTTGGDGRTSVTFTGGATLGTNTVSAAVTGVAASASFTIETSTLVIAMEDIAFVAPNGSDAVTVPVGTPIEWVNRDNVQHTATSSNTPAGGTAIATGLISGGARSQPFTPLVEGTWTYFCEVHPGIMVGATITATASTGSATSPASGATGSGGSGH